MEKSKEATVGVVLQTIGAMKAQLENHDEQLDYAYQTAKMAQEALALTSKAIHEHNRVLSLHDNKLHLLIGVVKAQHVRINALEDRLRCAEERVDCHDTSNQ